MGGKILVSNIILSNGEVKKKKSCFLCLLAN